jgi:hypothetical protein
MNRLMTAALALLGVASVAAAQTTPGTPLGTTGSVQGGVTSPGTTAVVGGTGAVQTPGLYSGGLVPQYGMTTGYNPYGGMNYTGSQFGTPYYGGYNPYGVVNYGGGMQAGYAGGVYPSYSGGCGCGQAVAYTQPVVVDDGCGKKKKRRGLFR